MGLSEHCKEFKWKRGRKRDREKRKMVKSLIEGNLIHLVVLETGSPGRQGLRQSVCHLLFVFVSVIHALVQRLLSIARLHDPIPSDPTLYGPF